MPTAALADIHGNVQALDAVLADPRCAAAEWVVVLGDVVTGTFPAETLDRLTALGDRVRFLRGNADRLALEDEGEWYAWVRDRLGLERLATVHAWPLSFAIAVEGLGGVRCCHATPDDDEVPLTRITPDLDFAAALADIAEPVAIGGHTHVQFDRTVRRHRYVNVGAVAARRLYDKKDRPPR
jgi:predicted phosphodiesterase